MSKPSLFPCVLAFIDAFDRLLPEEREQVVGEMAAFCLGYRDGKEEAWRESLDLDCENVLNEASAETLAEIMTEAGVKPGTKGRLS